MGEKEKFHHLESNVMLSTGNGDYQEFICKLFGTEIYFYKSNDSLMHDFMHSLVNTFVSIQDDMSIPQEDAEDQVLHPLLISLPPRYSRTIYFTSVDERQKWLQILK
jgi:hypothetical protein